jgi:hypothetical protein
MNDNDKLVPASQLPVVGKVREEQVYDRDIQFERDCRAAGIDPEEWLEAVREMGRKWLGG